MRIKTVLCVAIAIALANCGGGGDGPSATGFCQALGGGGSTVTASPAANATFDHPERIFDGDLDTATTLNTVGGTGTSSIRGTAQAGTVAPAGMDAGVLIGESFFDNTKLTITTYLNGAQQDTGLALSTKNNDSVSFNGIRTTHPYDSIKATFALSGDSSSIALYELCITPQF